VRSQPHLADSLPRAVIALAVGLVVVLAAGVIVLSRLAGGDDQDAAMPPARTGPLGVVPVPAPASGSADCATLLAALPTTLPGAPEPLTRAQLADPAPPATVAWANARSHPVVLRCGLDRPRELTPGAAIRAVSGVQWLFVEGDGATTWYLVDRPVYVALTVPGDAGTGPLQDVSAVAGRVLAAVPVRVN